jgi:hypothetical protein
MDLTKLHDDYQFTIEPIGKKLRLMVSYQGVENVCRLETEKNLKKFIGRAMGLLEVGCNSPVFKLMKAKLL